jgi:hypothetical protein
MKLSIQDLLAIRQRNFSALNRAFAIGLGDSYSDADYSLDADGAKKVAEEIEKIANEAEQDSDFFPLTAEQKMANVREANDAAEAFRDLVYNVFKL